MIAPPMKYMGNYNLNYQIINASCNHASNNPTNSRNNKRKNSPFPATTFFFYCNKSSGARKMHQAK